MKLWKAGAAFVAALGMLAVGVAIGGILNVSWNNEFKISPVEFVTVVLAALSVLLALLTIFLAVFAFLGWRSISDGVKEHSLTYLSDELQEGKPMFTLIRNAVVNAMYEGVQIAEDDEPFPAELIQDPGGSKQ